MRRLVLVFSVGCSWMIQSKPGEVRKDVVDGWQLSGILIPIGGVQVVRIDAQQVKQSAEASLSLTVNSADHPIDCDTVTLVAAAPLSLTKVHYQEAGRSSQNVTGRVPLADLKAVSAHPFKIDWCDLVISLDDAQVAKLKEFAEMAGG